MSSELPGPRADSRDTAAGEPYYLAYEDRYRRVYAQGVEFWTADPEEVRQSIELLEAFLRDAAPNSLILECGCGEGHLALHLAGRGFRYMGVDISPVAIAKARQRVAALSPRVPPAFHVADSTQMGVIPDSSIGLLVDNFHLHMLLTDGDRRRYLAEARRVLRPGGRAFFHDGLKERGALEAVASYEDYLRQTSPDLVAEEDRQAWRDGKPVFIRLPRLPARANSREGYARELRAAGFEVVFFDGRGETCAMHAKRMHGLH